MLKTSGKPPLARSPIRQSRKPLQPASINAIQSSPGGSLMKSQKLDRFLDVENSDLRPEYETVSCDLEALIKMVHRELGTVDTNPHEGILFGAPKIPLFERGRFYNEYAARRNERLKRKKCETEGLYEKQQPDFDRGARVESAKKRETSSRRRKSSTPAELSSIATPMAERSKASTSRYSLRSHVSKENKNPPLPPTMMSVDRSERKVRLNRSTQM